MTAFDWIAIGAAILAGGIAIWAGRRGYVWIGRIAQVVAHILSFGGTLGMFPSPNRDRGSK